MPLQNTSSAIVRFGAFEVNLRAGELRKQGIRIKLQAQPLRILTLLLQRPGDVVTREELRTSTWPADTFVDFDNSLNTSINKLREALGDSADNPRFIETLPRRGYRFIAPVESLLDPPEMGTRTEPETEIRPVTVNVKAEIRNGIRKRWRAFVLAAPVVMALAGGGYFYFHPRPKLTDKDTIVLADFTNKTGDPVFDGTLRQGLSVQLEQSPFLSTISDRQIQQTLEMMGQKPDAKLTPEIARELCRRTGGSAVLDGSIATLGNQYVLGLRAVNCRTGDTLAEEQTRAIGKEQVLAAMDKAVANLRSKLGESLSTVQKFDTPLEQATTPSLEALQACSLGRKTMADRGDYVAAVPFFQRAIQLDPNFAMAYALLGTSYNNLRQTSLGAQNTRKAYELRDRVSEPEKLYIETHYHDNVTGDLEKARQAYELWAQIYPRDWLPPNNLSSTYRTLGQYDKALAEAREAVRLYPGSLSYAGLINSYLSLNRLTEARATAEEALAKFPDSPFVRFNLHGLGFLQNDASGMAQQVAWAAGKPGVEDVFSEFEAGTAGYFGLLAKAREFSRQAVTSAERAGEKETAAYDESEAALREALFGEVGQAQRRAASAQALSTARDVQYGAALALVFAGDATRTRAQKLANDLAARFPEDTVVQFNYLPTLRAQLALNHGDALKAIEVLQAAVSYEMGQVGFVSVYPVYVRGVAYLAANRGAAAAVEFKKVIDHPGIVFSEPIAPLARLGLARAYTLSGDIDKSRTAYQDFLALWKDADPDIAILKQAKAEYAKLQ